MALDYNGWTNYETWNVALWIQNDEFLYNTAKACVTYCPDWETPFEKFEAAYLLKFYDFRDGYGAKLKVFQSSFRTTVERGAMGYSF